MNKAIKKAIQTIGSQAKLAQLVGVSQPTVWAWLHNQKNVSPEKAAKIVEATKGEVQGYEIRPDLPLLFPKPTTKGD